MKTNDVTKEQIEFVITLFFGFFGVHKFMKREVKMGLIYLFTGGLFGIGWIIDLIKLIASGALKDPITNSVMGKEGIELINNGKIPCIPVNGLNLEKGETCCYVEKAYTFTDKTITTGYTGKRNGISFRIAKGISYHTGANGSKAVRETQRTTYEGMLYITTNRVIYTSEKDGFDKTFEKITSIQEAKDGLIIQIGSKTYSIIVSTHSEFMKVFNILKDTKENGGIIPEKYNLGISSSGKELLFEKMYDVDRTNTEGRQKLIKQLIKNDDFLKGNDYFQTDLICCDAGLEESEMPSGKPCINVIVKREDSQYPYQVGYICEKDEKELKEEIEKAEGYSVDLYVSTEDDGKFSLKVKVKTFKL